MSIETFVAQQSLNRTIRRLNRVPPRVGRAALRRGVFRAGSVTLKDSKRAAPRGRTGQFKRSMAKKDIRNARRGVYISLVGQKKQNTTTPRQFAAANRRTGRLSKGLSGQGKRPNIAWIESGTSQHTIKPRYAKQLWWNVGANRTPLSPARSAKAVRHPGHRGTGFLSRVERTGRAARSRLIQREINSEVRKLSQ